MYLTDFQINFLCMQNFKRKKCSFFSTVSICRIITAFTMISETPYMLINSKTIQNYFSQYGVKQLNLTEFRSEIIS